MTVDSFKFLPRILAYYYKNTAERSKETIPWTPIRKPLSDSKFGLVTSGGLYDRTNDVPFDIEKEKLEPTWGDPTYRQISKDIYNEDLGVSHLHINSADIVADFNIVLPIHRFLDLEASNQIGSLSPFSYSFMGYQGLPPDTTEWEENYGPKVAKAFLDEGVDCVFLTPT